MMDRYDVLRQLYRGELHPEEQNIPDNEAYIEQQGKVRVAQAALCGKLDEELKKEFIHVIEMRSILASMESEHSYMEGMCMGACLALELTGWRQEMPEK